MTIEERMAKLDSNYAPHKIYHLSTEEKIFIGEKDSRKCRFCKKTEPEVEFNKIAHAIPEFVNNHNLFSYFECDSCNSKFARTIETHMGDYMNPFHTISQVRGKKGVPSVRKGGEKSKIELKEGALKVESHDGEREIFEFDEINKTVTLKAIRATYIPIAIYKCLTKMALTIIDEDELVNYENTLEWINEEEHENSRFKVSNLKCFYSFTPGPLPHNFTTCVLFKRKENNIDNVPYMIFLLAYGNYTFQIYVPLSKKDSGDIEFTAIPNPFDFENEFGTPKYRLLDFSSIEKVKNEEVTLKMSFDSFEDTLIEIEK
ncbi:MAG: HNH endonuclease [Bacteroidota bacterium]